MTRLPNSHNIRVGVEFTIDVFAIPLDSFDTILDVEFLQTLFFSNVQETCASFH
jgi:hypothetical protein